MGKIMWMLIMIPLSALFTGIGIFAWLRKEPMWFWAGSTVKESEIRDVRAYNRANGIMWLVYSVVFWASTILGMFHVGAAGIVLTIGCPAGIFALIIAYLRIYDYYKVKK